MDPIGMKYLAAGLTMFALIGSGYAMGQAARGGLDGMARNPEASGNLMTSMILAIAFAESLAIYALVVVFLLLFG